MFSRQDKPILFSKGCPPGFTKDGKPEEGGIDAGSDANGDNPVKKGPDHMIWEEKDKNGRLALYCVIDTTNPSLSHYQLVWIPTGGKPVMIGRCPFPRNGVKEGYGLNDGTKTLDSTGNVITIKWASRAKLGKNYSKQKGYKDIFFEYDVKKNELTTIETDTDKHGKILGPKAPNEFKKRDDHMEYPWFAMGGLPPMGDPAYNAGILANLFPGEECIECADQAVMVPPQVYNYIQGLHGEIGEEMRQRFQWEIDIRWAYPVASNVGDLLTTNLSAQKINRSGLLGTNLTSDIALTQTFENGSGFNAHISFPLAEWIRLLAVADLMITHENLSGRSGQASVEASYRVYASSMALGLTLGRTQFWNIRPKASVWLGGGVFSSSIWSSTITTELDRTKSADQFFDNKVDKGIIGGYTIGAQIQLVPHWSVESVYEGRGLLGSSTSSVSSLSFGLSYNF
ncbi:MAG: hypothetical protein HY089_09005 [Ignavibacteriales bacterium]|nr:hypothetical protein [Ignavibacteriales bacterium]